MPYVTTTELEKRPGAQEIAQLATPEDDVVVSTALMRLTLTGGSRAEYSAADIAIADRALAVVNDAIADTDQVIDGFLAKRYALPLNPVPSILRNWARVIVRYKLHAHRITDPRVDPVARDYNDAMKLLQLTADGKFSLGAADPVETSAAGDVQTAGPDRVFTTDTLSDFADV
jgi:phage gp36-like protein